MNETFELNENNPNDTFLTESDINWINTSNYQKFDNSYNANSLDETILKFESDTLNSTVAQKDVNKSIFPINYNRKNFFNSRNYFSKSQRWIGMVTEIHEESYFARLKDITNFGTDEECEFGIEEVSLEDKELLTIGSIFYWSIGYAVVNGQIIKESLIRFKRIPTWAVEDFDRAIDRAHYLESEINWD